MSSDLRADSDPRIPITVLTGFLGSGKTTLLNAYLSNPASSQAAVIINEFGEVGLDHLLVRKSDENLVLLENGCLCCTVRDDLLTTLRDLALRRERGQVPAFQRVVIETTGLADPVPIIHSLMSDLFMVLRYRIGSVVTAFDVVNGGATLFAYAEARKQVALADVLVLTKTDMLSGSGGVALTRLLRGINRTAPIERAVKGRMDPEIFTQDVFDLAAQDRTIVDWVASNGSSEEGEETAGHSSTAPIRSFCFILKKPMPWSVIASWLEQLVLEKGVDLLRIKGLVDVLESPGCPVLVHAVQHLFHPPETLAAWPSHDERSRLIFITNGIPLSVITDALRAVESRAARGATFGTGSRSNVAAL